MIGKFFSAQFFQLILFAITVGIATRVFAAVWRYFWHIESESWELGALIGSCIGLFILLNSLKLSPYWTWVCAGIIIAGRFLIKLMEAILKTK